MDIQRTGIILYTENYDACVAFYQHIFHLPVMFEETKGDFRLICLALGESYLMIETGGVADKKGKSIAESPVKIRINVADLQAALIKIQAYGLAAEIDNHSWGDVINIFDPDGNRVGIRDERGFTEQIHG
jgi:lactoylglutathione lyase